MIEVKVLGVGCANCKTTQDLIEKVCDDNDIAINLHPYLCKGLYKVFNNNYYPLDNIAT
jgi:hypothetical protein